MVPSDPKYLFRRAACTCSDVTNHGCIIELYDSFNPKALLIKTQSTPLIALGQTVPIAIALREWDYQVNPLQVSTQ